ncbi:MAG: glycosyltransferase family 2 protein [Tepidisphaeraceae bacterium]
MAVPLVSVILPAFNAERYVERAVRSILAQTFRDFECIVIDDGSTDATASILDRLASTDSRLNVIHQPNAGLIATLNRGIERATAPLVARMDADDIAHTDRLSRQVEYMNAHADVVLLGGAYRLIDEADRPIRTMRPPTEDAELQRQCLAATQPICHPLAMIRTGALRSANGYDAACVAAEDLDLFLRLGEIGKLACLDGLPLLDYRMHEASVSETKQALQRENQRKAVQAAMTRRGIPGTFAPPEQWRATTDDSRFHWTCTYGWWSLKEGYRSTARAFARKAIRQKPFNKQGWALLAKSMK